MKVIVLLLLIISLSFTVSNVCDNGGKECDDICKAKGFDTGNCMFGICYCRNIPPPVPRDCSYDGDCIPRCQNLGFKDGVCVESKNWTCFCQIPTKTKNEENLDFLQK